jgi:hypothetical protein
MQLEYLEPSIDWGLIMGYKHGSVVISNVG